MRFCELGDNKPVWGTDRKTGIGYCKNHQYLRTDISKETILQKAVNKQRANAAVKGSRILRNLATANTEVKPPKDYAELDRFFKEMQKRMTGRCENCGGKTEAFTKRFKNSIAHILQKAYFPSIATNENNWLELCFYGNSCHSQMDNKMIDLIDMNCFDQIITRFAKMYPYIAQDELRRVPPILIEYLKTEL